MINFSDNIETFEKIILKYVIYQDDDYVLVDKTGNEVDRVSLVNIIQPSFFTSSANNSVFKQIKDFHKTYNKIPNKEELCKMFDLKNTDIDSSEFISIENIDLHKYSTDFLFEYLRSFILVKMLNSQINKVAIKLKATKPDPNNIDEIFDYVRTALSEDINVDITNNSDGLDIFNPKSHIQPIKNTISTGFQYLDIVLGGGWEPGTFIVFQGRPKVGKSLVLSNLAVRSANIGNNVGVFTVELGDSKYIKRLGSNLLSLPYTEYSKFIDEDNVEIVKQYIDVYKQNNPQCGVLKVKEYPTGSASVLDIENYFIKLQKKNNMKFNVIFVDYVNLLKSSDGDTNLYSRIKKICEELRKIAMRNKWCVVSATQVKSNAFTTDDLGLDSTAESSGLVATVDSLFGITGNPDEPTLKIKNIANRDEGYMNSFAMFTKVKQFYRLVEDGDDYMDLGIDSHAIHDTYNTLYTTSNVSKFEMPTNTNFEPTNTNNNNISKFIPPPPPSVESVINDNNMNNVSINSSVHTMNNSMDNELYLKTNINVSNTIDDIPLD